MSKKPMELHPVKNRSSWLEFWKTFWNGEPPELKGAKAITGRLTNKNVKSNVTVRIKEILEQASEIKIGVMGDTEVRMDSSDYRNNFKFVNRVYKTTSKETAIKYEVELIKKFKKSHADKVKNISEARAGRLTTYNGFYYIYVVYNKIGEDS